MGVFGVAPANPVVAGSWYYGVKCSNCDKDVMLFEDVTRGERAKLFEISGTFQLECPFCQKGGCYGAGDLEGHPADFIR